MSYRDVGALLEVLPLPLLLLDDEGRLLYATPQAHERLPGLARFFDDALERGLDDPERWRGRLDEARRSSHTLPVRLNWAPIGQEAVAINAGIHFAAAAPPRQPCYIVSFKTHVDAASRFVALRDQLERLDAEIARRDRAEEALRDRESWLTTVLRSIADAVITTDIDGRVTSMNPAAESLTGWPADQAMGRTIGHVMDLVHEDSLQVMSNPVFDAMRHRRPTGMMSDATLIRRDGVHVAVEDTAAPIFDDRSRLVGGVIVFHDVTEKRRLAQEMAERATHDALTGLFNRFEFDARLAQALESARSGEQAHALLYVDLDHFKVVNDTAGHAVGDALLCEVVGLLQSAIRASDTLARLGGDEFGILLPCCGLEAAHRVADAVHQKLEKYRFEHGDQRYRIGASIGLALIDQRWDDPGAVLQAADTACYAAKEAGGHQTRLWHETGEAAEVRGRMVWARRLTHALEDHRFELFLQRIAPLQKTDGPAHVEALIRLRAEDGGLIAPGTFLPAAERFRLAPAIDRWVLDHVLDALMRDPGADVVVAINVSGQSIGDRSFRDDVLDRIRAAGPAHARRLCIEMTETAAVTSLGEASRFMARLRDMQVAVALDDFGSGTSSFGYLRQLPIDWLKIDGQFVERLPDDALGATAVKCFVEAARVVGAKSVAERVETGAALEALSLMGVDFAQGYHLHRPAPWAEVWPAIPRQPLLRSVR